MKLPVTLYRLYLPVWLCILVLSSGNARARDKTMPFGIEIKSSFGFIIRHHQDMGIYTLHHFPGLECNIAFPTLGKQTWQSNYNYPVLGLSYWYSSLANTSILGDVHAVFPWIRFPVIGNSKSEFDIRVGLGMGYFKRKFDRYGNYKNLAIGSHLNANLQLLFEYRHQISNSLTASAGLGLSHFSNGTLVTPNYGINYPHLNLGFTYSVGDWTERLPKPTGLVPEKRWEYSICGANAVKEIMPILGMKYLVFSLAAEVMYKRTLKGGVGAALDIYWDQSEGELLRRNERDTVQSLELLKPGLKLIKEWELGRLKLDFAMGAYLYQREKTKGAIYHMIGMKYYVTDRLFANLFLKTHFARADFIGWGCGYNINI